MRNMNYVIEYPGSALLYLGVLCLSLIFAFLATHEVHSRNKIINIWVILLIALLVIFAGIRGESVGVDVAHYIVRHIEPIREGAFSSVDQPIGFKSLVWLVYQFTDQTWVVFLSFSLITNALIVLRLWDFRDKSSFSMMIFWYYCFYYIVSFNIFRQFIAVAIIFYFTRFLESKNYKIYILAVALAITFHSTAILGFVPLFIDIYLSDEKIKERKLRKYFTLAMPIIIIAAVVFVYYFYDYDHYMYLLNRSTNQANIGISIPVKLVLGIAMYRIINREIRHYPDEKVKVKENELKKITANYTLGLIIALMSFIASEAERFSFYYMQYETVFVSFKSKKDRKLIVLRVLYILLGLYTLYSRLSGNGLQIMPYVLFGS